MRKCFEHPSDFDSATADAGVERPIVRESPIYAVSGVTAPRDVERGEGPSARWTPRDSRCPGEKLSAASERAVIL